MKKVFKKLVAAVATAVMTICATVAMTTEAKADTTKELYLVVENDAEYSMGFWSPSGITISADMAADGWTYLFEKVEDGLYKLSFSVTDDYTATGMSLCVDGAENYKADPQWSGDAGAAAWTALTEALASSDAVYITLAENDTQSTIAMTTAPGADNSGDADSNEAATEEATTEETTTEESTTKAAADDTSATTDTANNNDDGSMLPIIIVVAVVVVAVVVVIVKKKK